MEVAREASLPLFQNHTQAATRARTRITTHQKGALLESWRRGSLYWRFMLLGREAAWVSLPPRVRLMGSCALQAQPEASRTGERLRLRSFSQATKAEGPDTTAKMPMIRKGNCHQAREKTALAMLPMAVPMAPRARPTAAKMPALLPMSKPPAAWGAAAGAAAGTAFWAVARAAAFLAWAYLAMASPIIWRMRL